MTGTDKKPITKKSGAGFSMVELLITGFVFSVIFGVATSTFVNAIRVQKYNMAHQQLLDQTSYAIEYMARALRMAKTDNGDCEVANRVNYKVFANGRGIRFRNYNDECQELEGVDLDDNGVIDIIIVSISSPSGVFRLQEIPLNSTDYSVTGLKFYITGEDEGDGSQPRATIFMELQDNRLIRNNPRANVQTTVSQREFDS